MWLYHLHLLLVLSAYYKATKQILVGILTLYQLIKLRYLTVNLNLYRIFIYGRWDQSVWFSEAAAVIITDMLYSTLIEELDECMQLISASLMCV